MNSIKRQLTLTTANIQLSTLFRCLLQLDQSFIRPIFVIWVIISFATPQCSTDRNLMAVSPWLSVISSAASDILGSNPRFNVSFLMVGIVMLGLVSKIMSNELWLSG